MPTSVLTPSDFNVADGVPQLDGSGNLQAVVVQKHDTTANLASITGPAWSLAVDTTTKQVKLLDGSTAGGIALNAIGDVIDIVYVTASANWDDSPAQILQNSDAPVVVVYFDAGSFPSSTATINAFSDGAFVGQRIILIPYNSTTGAFTCYVTNNSGIAISPGLRLDPLSRLLLGSAASFLEFIWAVDPNENYPQWQQSSGGGTGSPLFDLANVKQWGTLFANASTHQSSGTSETTLSTRPISNTAGSLPFNTNIAKSRILTHYTGTFAQSSTATRQLKLKFAGTMIFDSGALSSPSSGTSWSIRAKLYRVSNSEVKCFVEMVGTNITIASPISFTDVTGLDLDGTSTSLVLTGTAAGTGAATGDIALEIYDLESR